MINAYLTKTEAKNVLEPSSGGPNDCQMEHHTHIGKKRNS